MQSFEANLVDAVETVSAWDLPDDEFAAALNAQTRMVLGVPPEAYWRLDIELPPR